MVQSVTYQSEKQSVYFQGKLIVLENLIPVLSPDGEKPPAFHYDSETGNLYYLTGEDVVNDG